MLVLDDECFIVDAVMLADEENDQGWMSVRAPEVSRRSLVGNGAYIPHGTVIPKNVFHANLGAFTLLMKGEFIPAKPSWRGCPAAMA
nr:hypothetical protein [uncultured Undibacterium sp.]